MVSDLRPLSHRSKSTTRQRRRTGGPLASADARTNGLVDRKQGLPRSLARLTRHRGHSASVLRRPGKPRGKGSRWAAWPHGLPPVCGPVSRARRSRGYASGGRGARDGESFPQLSHRTRVGNVLHTFTLPARADGQRPWASLLTAGQYGLVFPCFFPAQSHICKRGANFRRLAHVRPRLRRWRGSGAS
jgi:hypothetical protein